MAENHFPTGSEPNQPQRGRLMVELYEQMRDAIFTEFPEDVEELEVRCERTGTVATISGAVAHTTGPLSADDFWTRVGDKPLFTNMSVEAGRAAEAAWALGLFPDWRELASSGWNIVDLGAGNARADSRFSVSGALAQSFYAQKRGGGVTLTDGRMFQMPKTATFRLYMMQQLARWLAKESGGEPNYPNAGNVLEWLVNELAPHQPIAKVRAAVEKLATQFGLGWGVTTVLHGLMDLGFWVVKPDVHLVRSVALLGCLTDSAAALSNPEKYLSHPDTLFEVVDVCRRFAPLITPLPQSQRKSIREVDIVLMRASYRSIVDRYVSDSGEGKPSDADFDTFATA